MRLILYRKSPTVAPVPASVRCDDGSRAPLDWDRVFPLLLCLANPVLGSADLWGEIKGGFRGVKGSRIKGRMGNSGSAAYIIGRAELNLFNFLLRFFLLKFPAVPSITVCAHEYKKYPLCYFFKLKQFSTQRTGQCRCLGRNV